MFHQRRQHPICFARTFKRSKKSCRVFKIKEDPERLSAYNGTARQIKNEAEKPGDDSQNEKNGGI